MHFATVALGAAAMSAVATAVAVSRPGHDAKGGTASLLQQDERQQPDDYRQRGPYSLAVLRQRIDLPLIQPPPEANGSYPVQARLSWASGVLRSFDPAHHMLRYLVHTAAIPVVHKCRHAQGV